MSLFLLIIFPFILSFEIQVIYIQSPSTPLSLKNVLDPDSISSYFSINIINFEKLTEPVFESSHIVIDATFTTTSSLKIQKLCSQYSIAYVTLNFDQYDSTLNLYSLIQPPDRVVNAISLLLSYLSWTDFGVFISEKQYFIESSNKLLSKLQKEASIRYIINDDMNLPELSSMIAKLIKPSSTKVFVVISEEKTAEKILQSLKSNKLLGTGSGILIYSNSIPNTLSEGLLYLMPKGLEFSTTTNIFYQNLVLNLLNHVQSNLPFSYSQLNINNLINDFISTTKSQEFSIVNTQSSLLKIIGSISDQVTLNYPIIYPGGQTDFIHNYRTPIVFGYAGGQNNGPGIPETFYNPGQMLGALFSTKIANNDNSLLPHFNFTPIITDCGVNTNNQSYITECLDNFTDLGVGFLSTAWYPSTVPYFKYFSPRPVIGTDTSTEMSDNSLFPTFIRVTAPSTYNVVVLMTIIKIYGWKQVSVLCTNIPKFLSMCEKFETLAKNNNIKILNSKKLWTIENFYTKDRFSQDKDKMQEIIDCGARIFIALIPSADLFELVEGFYDLGMRAGDLQILFQSKTGAAICSGISDIAVCEKRKEILTGTLGVYMAEWSGSYGQEMEKEIIKEVGTYTAFKCTAFDQGMLMVRSIASVINMGYDYEDPKILNNYMRRSRFIGCSGTVSLSQDTNDRSNQPTYVANVLMVNDTPSEVYTALYDPSSQHPFEIIRPVVWTGQTKHIPDDYRFSLNCPFDETKAEDSKAGLKALYIVCFVLATYTGILILMLGKFLYKTKLEMITSKKLITGQDMTIFIIISIEVFQYFSVGISPSDSSSLVRSLSELTSINFTSFLHLEGSDYWNMILVVIILSWIFLSISILILLRSKKVILFRSNIFNWLDFFSEYIMPVYGDLGFIPILSVILDTFTCTKSVESGITKSYNSHDCNNYCWTGSHLSLSILAIITLIVYLPSFLVFRPIWQNYQKTLNIKQYYRYSLYKSFFQTIVVIFSKTVFYSNEVAFGFLFTFSILAYAFSLKFIKGYCYEIANLWLIFSLIVAAYSEFLYTISITSQFDGQYVAVALFLGWVTLGLIGGFIQNKYYHIYLYSEPSKDIPEIFEYAFRNNASKYVAEKQDSLSN